MDKRVIANEILLEEAAALMTEGRDVTFTPLGSSMDPFISGGKDSVTMRRMADVEVGDIVLVRLPDRYVLHRVFRVEGDALTLMGDGNVNITETCTKNDILGTVTGIIRGGREHAPGKAVLWRRLLPIRRYLLAFYRRIIKKI